MKVFMGIMLFSLLLTQQISIVVSLTPGAQFDFIYVEGGADHRARVDFRGIGVPVVQPVNWGYLEIYQEGYWRTISIFELPLGNIMEETTEFPRLSSPWPGELTVTSNMGNKREVTTLYFPMVGSRPIQ